MGFDLSPIVIGSDHAGYNLKMFVKHELEKLSIPCQDEGTSSATESVDYPVFSAKVAKLVSTGVFTRGITVCGSGIGASIAANRFSGVRAALCVTPEMARLSRLHNNANVLAMGERITTLEVAKEILVTWLETAFEAGRHIRRVEQLDTVAL